MGLSHCRKVGDWLFLLYRGRLLIVAWESIGKAFLSWRLDPIDKLIDTAKRFCWFSIFHLISAQQKAAGCSSRWFSPSHAVCLIKSWLAGLRHQMCTGQFWWRPRALMTRRVSACHWWDLKAWNWMEGHMRVWHYLDLLERNFKAEGLVVVGVQRILLNGCLLLLQPLAVLHQMNLDIRVWKTDTGALGDQTRGLFYLKYFTTVWHWHLC